MGNFYTNITFRGVSADQLVSALTPHRRSAFVAPDHPGGVTIFDQACETQDVAILAGLAQAISGELQCPALAILNHDDDVLALALYQNGTLTTEYESGRPANLKADALCRAWQRPFARLPVWLLLHAPRPVFELTRHSLLARLLGLPPWSVGTGYNYLRQGEYPPGLSPTNVRSLGVRP